MDFQELLNSFTDSVGNFGLKQILPAVAVLVACLLIRKGILTLLKKQLDARPQGKQIAPIVTAAVSIALIVLTLIIVCSILSIPMTSLVAILSVFTLAISMAAQGALTNVAGCITILYSKPFAVGDYVSIGGTDGTVTEIGLFYTRLRTFDSKAVSVPNSTVASATVTDFSTHPTRRMDINISASYDDDVDHVLRVLSDFANSCDKVLKDPAPFVAVTEYGNSAISYVIRVWVKSPDYFEVMFGIQNSLARVFRENGIQMTYDHVNVHLMKEE